MAKNMATLPEDQGLILCNHKAAQYRDAFALIGTRFSSLPSWSDNQWLSKNIPDLWCHIGTAEEPGLKNRESTELSAS